MSIKSIVIFGDTYGIPKLIKFIPYEQLSGIVAASIRPHQHKELSMIASSFNLPFIIQPSKKSTNYSIFSQKIKEINPDLIITNSYSMMLYSDILEIPTYGAINIHGALLPQYRGCNPIQYALLNNEAETGVTMHYMTPRFDDGDIIAQKRTKISF